MYVDFFYKKNGESEKIRAVERVNGERVFKEYDPDYHFYLSDQKGTYKSIYGDPLKKIIPTSFTEKQKLIKSLGYNSKAWESDVDVVVRCIEQNYQRQEPPELHVAFFDIETSFDKELGWSEASDANNYITSISIHLQWIDEIICLAIPPETVSKEEAEQIAKEVGNVILFADEGKMLDAFMDIIQDADVLSHWNGEAYDIPYVVNRIKKVLGRHESRKLCLWEQEPKPRDFERGGKTMKTYDLIGRVSMDYMQLYKKYNYEERQSYALNAIAEAELGDSKVPYDGTLDELYNCDFKKFLEYNIKDTLLIDKLDKKLKFIDLANSIAHANCVLIPTTMGAVGVTDQAIMMEAHSKGLICPNKQHGKDSNDTRAAGGWVGTPKRGLSKWIGSVDLNSLYPNTIRAFNMSPETIMGQIRLDRTNSEIEDWEAKGSKYTFANWWNDRFNVLEMEEYFEEDISKTLILDMENGDSFEITGAELKQLVLSQNWCISANGTLFRTDKEGIIPGLMSRWFSERKIMQNTKQGFVDILSGVEIPDNLKDQL